MIDPSLSEESSAAKQPEVREDNVRVYVPLDLNREAFLRRLERIIARYGEANEENETNFEQDVDAIISQVEIYDQVWFVRKMPSEGYHSFKAIELVKEIIARLESIPDGCAESFPFNTINRLKKEFLTIRLANLLDSGSLS